MAYSFESLPQLDNVRGKLPHDGWQPTNSVGAKTDIAIHHSLTDEGDAYSFSRYHVYTNGWPEIAYHFVILKDGTIQWCHGLQVISYHVGNSNSFSVGVCLVGDFRDSEPTKEQQRSLRELHAKLKSDMPNYKRTRGHDEFPGYSWKACPEFDYRAVIKGKGPEYGTAAGGKGARTFSKDDKGIGVERVQNQLIEAGYGLPKYGADGHYGDETVSAVRSFQLDHDLSVDGIAGPKTQAKLKEVAEMANRPFKDVPADHYAAEDIRKAKEQGIIKGNGDGTFGFDENTKKQDVVAIVMRALDK